MIPPEVLPPEEAPDELPELDAPEEAPPEDEPPDELELPQADSNNREHSVIATNLMARLRRRPFTSVTPV